MKYSLIGVNGNAFNIMAYASRAMRECGKSKHEINAYLGDAKNADYNHLLMVSDATAEKLNEELNEIHKNH